jgi:hypothetical protein
MKRMESESNTSPGVVFGRNDGEETGEWEGQQAGMN